ncbi:uncharacterized protein LOC142823131 isoform X4 [Pelodiscus sinensis]|uniref:uncharacterized protein LOC142823131 isoform X4 n=1 Tax=Pelodiscus sinensis TaxID=13735 RepID=UPI003F6A8296
MLTSRPGASLACPSPPSWHSAGQQQQQPRAPLQPSRAARDIQRLFSGFWCRAMADNGAQTVLWKHPGVLGAAAVIGAAVVIIIALAAALGVERSKQPPPCPPTSGCPENWIRIQGKFYYFSKAEGNWTNSQKNCSSHAASLATIESLRQLADWTTGLASGRTQAGSGDGSMAPSSTIGLKYKGEPTVPT